MNLKQLSYRYGRLKNDNHQIICPAITAASIAAGANLMRNGDMEHFIFMPMLAGFCLFYGGRSILSIKSKKRLNQLKKNEDLRSENIDNIRDIH